MSATPIPAHIGRCIEASATLAPDRPVWQVSHPHGPIVPSDSHRSATPPTRTPMLLPDTEPSPRPEPKRGRPARSGRGHRQWLGSTLGSTAKAEPIPGRAGHEQARGPQVAGAEPSRRGYREWPRRSEEHTSELQSRVDLVCRLLLEKKNKLRGRHPFRHKKPKTFVV